MAEGTLVGPRILATLLLVLASQSGIPQSQPYTQQPPPRLPFFDWNACPFEGCAYRQWTAVEAVEVFDTWKNNRKHILTLPAKERVTGVTGVVITYKPGVIRMKQDLPEYGLVAGDSIL